MPTDRGEIDRQLQELGEGTRWWNVRELRDLPAILDAGERIAALARGKVGRVRAARRAWLIVVTDRRLLCLRSGRGPAWRQLEVPLSDVLRASLRVGPFRGRVIVTAGDRTLRLLVPREDAYRVQAAVASTVKRPSRSRPRLGPTHVVGRMLDHVLSLPAVALGPETNEPAPPVRPDPVLRERVDGLEHELAELREQVAFLEQLLRRKQLQGAAAADSFSGSGFEP